MTHRADPDVLPGFEASPGRGRAVSAESLRRPATARPACHPGARPWAGGPMFSIRWPLPAQHLLCLGAVGADDVWAGDGLGHVGDGAVAPPPDLVPEQR